MRDKKNHWIVLGLAGALCLTVAGCRGCEDKSDAQLIREKIEEAARLAEKHDIAGLVELCTKDLQAQPGGHDRQSVKGVLLFAFKRYGQFEVAHPRPSIEVDPGGSSAQAKVPFLIVRGDKRVPGLQQFVEEPKAWLEQASEIADPYYLELLFEKQDGEWKARRAELRGLPRLE